MIAAIISLLFALAGVPRFATCPIGTWINGVARDGRYECIRTWGSVEGSELIELGRSRGRVHCFAGEVPVVVDERRVRCVRRSS